MKSKSPFLLVLFFSLIFFTMTGFVVVGHRGDPTKYPEETIQSDNSAFRSRSGANYVELDLRLSKDGVPVISHDEDLFRMTHTHAIVSQNTFQTLHQFKYDNGEHVLSLNELFNYYRNRPHTKFILETKVNHHLDHSYALEEKIAQLIKQYKMQKRVMIHSFSAASLFKLRKLLPHAYLILIVGSLGRINFSILPQINAVNISSDLIQQHAWAIHWSHSLHKQVYVWTEMNETPSFWHWLINKNIDGVVTNYPALGFKYQLAKKGTKKYSLHDQPAVHLGQNKTAVMSNPYIRIKQRRFIYPGQKLRVMYGVQIKQQLYYQIAKKTFISAGLVNLDLRVKDISPFFNKMILARPAHQARLYSQPDNLAKSNRFLPRNHLYQIKNFNGTSKNLWLLTNLGWVKAHDILFYGFFSSQQLKTYRHLPKMAQIDNLTPFRYYRPDIPPITTYWQQMAEIKQFLAKKN